MSKLTLGDMSIISNILEANNKDTDKTIQVFSESTNTEYAIRHYLAITNAIKWLKENTNGIDSRTA